MTSSTLSAPSRHRRLSSRTEIKPQPAEPRSAYDREFWLAFLSNVLSAVAVCLLFRYADFITLLGGTEFHLGWIVGVGMVGSLLTRSFLGSWIDRHGTRWMWLCSLLLFAGTCFAHLAVQSYSARPSICSASVIAARWPAWAAPRRPSSRCDVLLIVWPKWSACWAPPALSVMCWVLCLATFSSARLPWTVPKSSLCSFSPLCLDWSQCPSPGLPRFRK